jgi:hypothetical protein
MNKQDWYLGQLVSEADMDLIYTDVEAIVESLASNANLGQGSTALAHRYGGILSGLVVTRATDTSVDVTAGAAIDGDGKQIVIPASTVSLVRLGSTEEGDSDAALGDGSLTADSISAGEAWLSLYVAFDVNLSNKVFDSLDAEVWNRQTDSFHFELLIGADAAAPASSRANLDTTRVLLCDILLDNDGYIRQISGNYAICNSSKDFNVIGYGLEDTAALFGRRSDWIAIDADGVNFILLQEAYDSSQNHNHAYHNIRAGSAREAIAAFVELYATEGTASKAGGSEIIGGRPITKTLNLDPGTRPSNIDMPSGSIHDQLEALYDFVKKLMWRGGDVMEGDFDLNGALNASGACTLASGGNAMLIDSSGNVRIQGTTQLDADVTCNGNLSVVQKNLSVSGALWFAPKIADGPAETHAQSLSIRGGSMVEQWRQLACGLFIAPNVLYETFPEVGIAAGFNDRWQVISGGSPASPFIDPGSSNGGDPSAYTRVGGGTQVIRTSTVSAEYQRLRSLSKWVIGNKPFLLAQLRLRGATWAEMNDEITVGFNYLGGTGEAIIKFDGDYSGGAGGVFVEGIAGDSSVHTGTVNLLGSNTLTADPDRFWTVFVGILNTTTIVGGVLDSGGTVEQVTMGAALGTQANEGEASGVLAAGYAVEVTLENPVTPPSSVPEIWINKIVVVDRPSLV